METPKNTVGQPVAGQSRTELPDQMPATSTNLGAGDAEAARPSEVAHPHARTADHLRPQGGDRPAAKDAG